MQTNTPRSSKEIDTLIARLLVGKPGAKPEEIRRLIPETANLDDKALTQKLEFLRQRLGTKAPARS